MGARRREPWELTFADFAQGLWAGVEAAARYRAERKLERMTERGAYPRDLAGEAREQAMQALLPEARRYLAGWEERVPAIWRRLQEVIRAFTACAPGAIVRPGGSFARGEFYLKGPRHYDFDLHVSGVELPCPRGRTIALPEPLAAAVTAARLAAMSVPLDIYVEHDTDLWAVEGKRLVRLVPEEMWWKPDFVRRFRADVDTHRRLVADALGAGRTVPQEVLAEEGVPLLPAAGSTLDLPAVGIVGASRAGRR